MFGRSQTINKVLFNELTATPANGYKSKKEAEVKLSRQLGFAASKEDILV